MLNLRTHTEKQPCPPPRTLSRACCTGWLSWEQLKKENRLVLPPRDGPGGACLDLPPSPSPFLIYTPVALWEVLHETVFSELQVRTWHQTKDVLFL